MPFRPLLTAVCLCLSVSHAAAANDDYFFDYNARCAQAYQRYMALQLPEGDALIRQEFLANPHNLMATYISDYGDFLLIFFNGDPDEMALRRGHQDERLNLMSRAPDSDPWKLLARAGVNLHWAVLKARFGENLKAAASLRKSYLQLKDNQSDFPDFMPNTVFLGLEEAVVGTIPSSYQWLASILGMKGNVRRGAERLATYLKNNKAGAALYEEAFIYRCYIAFYLLNRPDESWRAVSNEQQFPAQGNLMRLFLRANLALNYRKADAALAALHDAAKLPEAARFPSVDYELGNALLYRLDKSCIYYYQQYVSKSKGQLFIKDAWQKMGLAWYVQGNKLNADRCLNFCAKRGNKMTDADKQAARFAALRQWPNTILLQVRLLTDGGYAQQALSKLAPLSEQSFTAIPDRLEYVYRYGRAQEETGNAAAAVQAYQRAINIGRGRPEQFGARAALQMALIYEGRGQKTEARNYFRQCLDMPEHDFQSSIDQQAKAGLNRLGT